MDDSQAAAKGMRIMGGHTGMDGHEKCTQIVPDVPLFTQCPIPDVGTPLTIIMPSWEHEKVRPLANHLG